jgi:hypothetical protein
MNDCPNAEIRDQLPDLLHDRLSSSTRAGVMAHVATCADCRDELELLRGVHEALAARAPQVDVDAIVRALPRPSSRQVQPVRRRRSWSDWRVAAAVTLLVAGGSSVVVYDRIAPSGTSAVASIVDSESLVPSPAKNAVEPVGSASASQSPVIPTSTVASAQPKPAVSERSSSSGLGLSGRLADLDDRQLEALLSDIDHLEATPITEPEPVTIRIEPTGSTSSNDRGGQ